MVGIQETKDVIILGLAIGNGVYASLADNGKIGVEDMANLLPIITALPNALEGIGEVPKEIKDLNEAELAEIKNLVLEKLPNIGDKWLVVARESMNIGLAALKIYNAFKAE